MDKPAITIGWKFIRFGKGHRRHCAKCGRLISRGIVNVNAPGGNALCRWCYAEIMATPTPGSFHPEAN